MGGEICTCLEHFSSAVGAAHWVEPFARCHAPCKRERGGGGGGEGATAGEGRRGREQEKKQILWQ
jgi:hypothetical protein